MNKDELNIRQISVTEMSLDTYTQFQKLIYEFSGIALADSKRALLMNRIAKRMRQLDIGTPEEYLNYVSREDKEEAEALIDVVSTNTTHFFRETPHFDFLAKLCSEWTAANKRNVKIWCAAASSGQEPYTIAMCLNENFDCKKNEVKILGTDICSDVLLRSVEAVYTEKEVTNIEDELLAKYFEEMLAEDGAVYFAKDSLKKLLTFKRLNLSTTPYPLKGGFDVIFCRNVMIYFDRAMRQIVIDQMYGLLNPDGHLILSHSENLLGIVHKFKSLGASIYKK